MFSIIISEKGGAERREGFDKTEINVGRVQGNDLMLPKGNVSKRHARLLFRDGRFIVTDLKSTNGTYVNGRKIAQATIVREGDKIYIGDFVLRIELSQEQAAAAAAAEAPPPPTPSVNEESSEGEAPAAAAGSFAARGAAPPPLPGAPTAGPPPMPMAPPLAPMPPSPVPGGALQPPPMMHGSQMPTGPSPLAGIARETALGPGPSAPPHPGSHAGPMPPGPAPMPPAPVLPGPVPMGMGPMGQPPMQPAMQPPMQPGPMAGMQPPAPTMGGAPITPAVSMPAVPSAPPMAAPPMMAPEPAAPAPVMQPPSYVGGMPSAQPSAPPIVSSPSAPPAVTPAPSGRPEIGKISAPPPPASVPASSGSAQPSQPRSSVRSAAQSEGVVDASQAAAHRAALAALVDQLASSMDLSPLAGGDLPAPVVAAVERALGERAASLRSSGDLPPGVDADTLVGEARRELLDLGPIGPLLEDEYVEEVQVIRADHVVAMHGKKQVATEIAFTSEAAVARVLRRLCRRSGTPLGDGEQFVDRRLDHGARLFGVVPPASGDSHMLVIRKPQRALSTVDDLVRSGALSRAMATLLGQAIQGRANVLVTGSVGNGASALLGALAGAGNIEDRVVVLQEDDELIFNQPHTISMLIGDTSDEGARAVRAAIRVRPDRLVVGAFAGHVVAEVVDAIGDGIDGVLAAARAPTLRHLVARLPADLSATRAMLSLDTAREWLASSFDLVLEVARLRDGRHRVMRIAEFTLEPNNPLGLRDIFTFTVERTAAGGAVEGTFHSSGVVPRLAEDLVARGVPIDLSIFKRANR
jgi:pilus assembly protein CpaF